MDRNPADQSHLPRLEHNHVNQLSNQRNVPIAVIATETAGTASVSSVSSDQALSPAAAQPPSTIHANITVKVEDESMSGQSAQICRRVKMEEYDEEYLVVECDCEECIEKIKVEEEEIEVKREIEENLKMPVKRMDRVTESNPTGPPSSSTIQSTNSIPIKIEYSDAQVTTSLIDSQTSTSDDDTNNSIKDASIGGQTAQHCTRVKKEEHDGEYVMLYCDCGCEDSGKLEMKEEHDETDEELERKNDQSVHRCIKIKKEENDGEYVKVEGDCEEIVKMEIKEEFEEVEVKDDEHDRQVKRLKTEPVSDEEDGLMHDDRGGDAQDNEEGELIGGEQGGGIVGLLDNVNQVNDADQINVIQEDARQMDSQLQADIDDQIEVQPDQEHLSDIEYELEMLRNVFMKPIGNDDQFRCDYPKCGKRFGPDEQKLLAHLKLHTKPYVCDGVGCLRRFTSLRAFTEHKKSHSVNVLQCGLPGCVKRFKNVGTLNLHKRDHTDAKVFICEWGYCEKVFHNEFNHRAHHLTHSDDGLEQHQLMCDWAQCARQFTTQLNLSIHRQLHTGASPLDINPPPFPYMTYVRVYVPEDKTSTGQGPNRIVLNEQANEYGKETKVKIVYLNCTESNCTAKLDSLVHLHDHLRTVHQLSPLQCFATNCNARFDEGHQIWSHIKLHHSRNTRFLCTVCHKECDSQHNAYQHWYHIHQTGQFECNLMDDCAQVTDDRNKMKTHQAKHYTHSKHCTHPGCNAAFAFNCELKSHQLTHLNRNPFHCNWPNCSHRTKLRANLVVHIRTQHFGLPASMKEQKEKNIVDLRDPNEYVRVVVDE